MNKVEIFPSNEKNFRRLKNHLKTSSKGTAILPTGYGKTPLSLRVLQDRHTPGTMQLILGPSHGVWAEFEKHDPHLNQYCRFLTYNQLSRFKDPYKEILRTNPSVIILDEYTRSGAKKWSRAIRKLLKVNKTIKIIGITAMEIRHLDSRRDMAHEIFGHENIIVKKTILDAIEEGVYKKPRLITSLYSLSDTIRNFYEKVGIKDLPKNKALEIKSKVAVLVKKWKATKTVPKLLKAGCQPSDYKFIIFLDRIKSIQELQPTIHRWFKAAFPGRPISLFQVTSENSPQKNLSITKQFLLNRDPSKIDVILSVNILNETLHDPDLTCAIQLRKTSSLNVEFQQIGRVLFAGSKKTPKLFDLANNIKLINPLETQKQVSSKTGLIKKKKKQVIELVFDIQHEVSDIIQELSRLEFKNSTWAQNYISLKKAMKALGGNILQLSKKYPKEQYYLFSQFSQYKQGQLTHKKIMLLKKIGIDVKQSMTDIRWTLMFARLTSVWKRTGSLPTKNEKALRGWLRSLYRGRSGRRLTKNQKKLLEPFFNRMSEEDKKKILPSVPPLVYTNKEKKRLTLNMDKLFFSQVKKCPKCKGPVRTGYQHRQGKKASPRVYCRNVGSCGGVFGQIAYLGFRPRFPYLLAAYIENKEKMDKLFGNSLGSKQKKHQFLGTDLLTFKNFSKKISSSLILEYQKVTKK